MRSATKVISGSPSQRESEVTPRWSAKKSSSSEGRSARPKASSRSSSPAARTASTVAAHGDFRPASFGQPACQLRCGLARGGRSLGERQIVSDGHGFGLKAPEGVAVVERHPCREQTFRAVGVQFDAHEARHARRIAFRGGERLDTLREPLCGGGVGASEQFARRGVEHGDVSGDVARAAPGQMHGLV